MTENVSVGEPDVALNNEILRTLVGSGVHGMAIAGHDDRDEMGVYIETPEQLLGLAHSSEHYVSRTVPQGVRSGPGDTDLTIYSLRKYLRLAAAGNPTVLTVLFASEDDVLVSTPLGRALRSLTPAILSRRTGQRHLGYLDGQRERLLGGGRQSRVPNRPELIAAHGYDTKYASHALRLGLQGIEIMTTGRLSLPMREADLALCMKVKTGQVDFTEAVAMIDRIRAALAAVLETSHGPLPDEPDWSRINAWMVKAHREYWGWNDRTFTMPRLRGRDSGKPFPTKEIDALNAAINDAGRSPSFHWRTYDRHRREWPPLWAAIDALRRL